MPHPLMKDHPDLSTSIDVLDKWIEYTTHKNHQPGLAIGIVYDGELVWGKGYGYTDLETKQPVTLDTRFRIASITKTFTAVAIMQLRDAGKLGLDDPVSKYLSWFTLRYADAPEITIRNLLTHTSGLPRDAQGPMWTDQNAPEHDAFVAETCLRKPTRPPYDHFAYSNLGYSLLGDIIEAVSGQSWADYLQQNILEPLDMSETFPVPKSDDPLLAKGYSRLDDEYKRKVMPFFLMNGFEASANFASSVNDLVKYSDLHLIKGKTSILSDHTLRDMHRIQWLNDKWDGGYGFGMFLYKINDWVITGHTGGYPGYLTAFTLCQKHKTAVILLTNSLESNPLSYVEQAYKLVLPEIIKATEPAKPKVDSAWEKFVGDYVSDWGTTKVIVREGKLQIISLAYIDMPSTILIPTDQAHIFTLDEDQQSNETARFETDADGRVFKLWVRNEYSLKKAGS